MVASEGAKVFTEALLEPKSFSSLNKRSQPKVIATLSEHYPHILWTFFLLSPDIIPTSSWHESDVRIAGKSRDLLEAQSKLKFEWVNEKVNWRITAPKAKWDEYAKEIYKLREKITSIFANQALTVEAKYKKFLDNVTVAAMKTIGKTTYKEKWTEKFSKSSGLDSA